VNGSNEQLLKHLSYFPIIYWVGGGKILWTIPSRKIIIFQNTNSIMQLVFVDKVVLCHFVSLFHASRTAVRLVSDACIPPFPHTYCRAKFN